MQTHLGSGVSRQVNFLAALPCLTLIFRNAVYKHTDPAILLEGYNATGATGPVDGQRSQVTRKAESCVY